MPDAVVAGAGPNGLVAANLLADRGWDVLLGPRDLQTLDVNLDGGAIIGGTAELYQQLVFRPVPGWGRPETPSAAGPEILASRFGRRPAGVAPTRVRVAAPRTACSGPLQHR
jgi:phytoene dehydrogenase-like protein